MDDTNVHASNNTQVSVITTYVGGAVHMFIMYNSNLTISRKC